MFAWLRRLDPRTPRATPPTETAAGYCHVCGRSASFRSYEPIDSPCKRNTFLCGSCGSSARNRHVAQTILARLPTHPHSTSMVDFARNFEGVIWLTCTSGAIAAQLRAARRCIATEFIDHVPSGQIAKGVRSEDLQASSFATASVDLIVTEDVLEHVPHPQAAFAEIGRVLKPGGFHIGTIPVHWEREASTARAVIEDGKLRHILEPEYHVDLTRPEGILAFTDYGQDIVSRYCSIIGPSEVVSAHQDRRQEIDFAIYDNWVFVSQKPG